MYFKRIGARLTSHVVQVFILMVSCLSLAATPNDIPLRVPWLCDVSTLRGFGQKSPRRTDAAVGRGRAAEHLLWMAAHWSLSSKWLPVPLTHDARDYRVHIYFHHSSPVRLLVLLTLYFYETFFGGTGAQQSTVNVDSLPVRWCRWTGLQGSIILRLQPSFQMKARIGRTEDGTQDWSQNSSSACAIRSGN